MVLKFIFAISLLFAGNAQADVLFEGYYKILDGEQHIGYSILKYEFDPKKKEFKTTSFFKTGAGKSEVTESLVATADQNLSPISYSYTSLTAAEKKIVDAKFKKNTMTGQMTINGKNQKLQKEIPKGTFLSSFLVYIMLKSPQGLQAETNYEYQAIAEEDGDIIKGQALVGKPETYNSQQAYKVMNTFKGNKFLSYLNNRGEVLGTQALGLSIKTQLVGTAKEAIGSHPVSQTILNTLFGGTPKGEQNSVFKEAKSKTTEGSSQ